MKAIAKKLLLATTMLAGAGCHTCDVCDDCGDVPATRRPKVGKCGSGCGGGCAGEGLVAPDRVAPVVAPAPVPSMHAVPVK